MPDWQLSRVEITDMDSKYKYTFECKKWLALDKDDGKIDRIIREAVR
jgi:hypothetical protein